MSAEDLDSDCSSSEDDNDIDSGTSDEEVEEMVPHDVNVTSGRRKREIAWCGVDTEDAGSSRVGFVPIPSHIPAWRPGIKVRPNTRFGSKVQLLTRTRHYLAIYPDGKVRGTMDKSDIHTHVQLINAEHTAHLRIRGLLTNLYVAMNKKGRIYAEPTDDTNTIFVESIRGQYLTYLSLEYAHKGWYLAINKVGKMKNGKKTAQKQKAVQFMKRRKHFES